MSRPLGKALVTMVLLGIAAGAWILLAPRQLPGGSASYVVPSGTSMLPLLQRDDLVVVREAPSYGPGDVIAYDSAKLGRIVLHRVVRIEGDGFVTKGDNNEWLDQERPTADDVLGRMWVRVPGGGTVLGWIRTPRNAAVVGTMAAVLIVGGVGVRRSRRRRRRGDQPTPRASSSPVPLRVAAMSVAALFVATGAFAAYAHLRPERQVVPTRVPYQHQGTFEYSAAAEAGAVYPDGRVSSGEPVFLRLTDRVDVRFEYRFASDQPHAVTGTVALAADLEDGTGWHRSFPLQTPTEFSGDEATATGTLDLPRIGSLIRQVEKATQIPRPSYRLVLRPAVVVEGTLAGRPVNDEHRPELTFDADPLLLRLTAPEDPTEDPLDALTPSGRGSVVVRDELPNPVSIGPLHMEAPTARTVSLIGLAVAALGLLLLGLLFLRRNRSEPARIEGRYGNRMVPVADGASTLDGPVVDVATMAALARIADSYERMILHEHVDGAHSYLVEGDVALYRYRAGSPEATAPEAPSSHGPEPVAAADPPPAAPTPAPPPAPAAPAPAPTVTAPAPTEPAPAPIVPAPVPQAMPSRVPAAAAPNLEAPRRFDAPPPATEPHPHGAPNGDEPDWVAEESWWEEDGEDDGEEAAERAPMQPSTLADEFFLSQ